MSETCHLCGAEVATTDAGGLEDGFRCGDCDGVTCMDCKSLAVGHEDSYCVLCRG